eukprot:TRINITY_DN21375_c0_g1_i1.p1 TRINITY_DN21375_c0_g1~~TRINITY_DN21375_c0_g1_i1.p1  ORF type:complete len:373 (+),score=114.99 TRINITY_DN21375_c0_g1_i1:120-1238(+)
MDGDAIPDAEAKAEAMAELDGKDLEHGGEDCKQQYSGQYNKEGKRHGKGRMVFKYGVYEGDWEDDKMSGFGVLHLKTGNSYEGNFADNKFEGWGKLRWKSGKVYEGQLRAGVMCGKGRLACDEGIYEGEFYDNQMNGRGTMHFANGDIYTGEFRAGLMWGQGEMTTPKGAKMTGSFMKGMKHGRIMRQDGKGNEYSERYSRDELQVSVKVKSKPSRAGKAVRGFIGRIGGGSDKDKDKDKEEKYLENEDPGDAAALFERPDCTQADVEKRLDMRAKETQRARQDRRERSAKAPAAPVEEPRRSSSAAGQSVGSDGDGPAGTAFEAFFADTSAGPACSEGGDSVVSPSGPPPLPPGPPPPSSHFATLAQLRGS